MFEKIANLISEKLEIDLDKITMDTTFDDLKIDSLDMVEIVMDVEEMFNITIESNDDLKTVGDFVAHIETLV
ncbi:MAG: acyl carrier protein [Christensenellales bacterium]|jgi:acyl carrier protein